MHKVGKWTCVNNVRVESFSLCFQDILSDVTVPRENNGQGSSRGSLPAQTIVTVANDVTLAP